MSVFPETIPEILAWRAAEVGSRPWLFHETDSWTLSEVAALVDRHATGLADRGVAAGDRVAILAENQPHTLFAWFATNQLGAAAAPLNPALKAPELAALFHLMTPRALVTSEAHRALATSAIDRMDDSARPAIVTPEDLTRAGAGAPRAAVSPDDVAVLIATSGTTGAPKAVAQTHRTFALAAEAFPAWCGLDERDRLLAALPLFHINAQAYSTMGALGSGGSLALLTKFSASRFWEDAKRLGATQFNAVGAMVKILLGGATRDAERAHALRVCYAALALPEAEHKAFEQRFGLSMIVGYGMSETTFGTVWPRGVEPRYGTMGVLRQHPRLGSINRARVVREDGTDARDGETGELWLSNPATMRGYWNAPAETAAALADGFLRTGDLVQRDADGHFTFVARKKDVIRRRGENVAAAEVEAVLASHPSVHEAAVVGVPSSLGEEDIVAFVAPRPDRTIDIEALRAWTRERLADFKVPTIFHVRAELPHTATERIAKHLLKKEL